MGNKSKQKGTAFETQVAAYLREALECEAIERRTLAGTQDRGDLAGVTIGGKRAVIECKACARMEVPQWLREAETERTNDGAAFGVVVAKRRGVGAANTGQQLVLMTLDTFASIVRETK